MADRLRDRFQPGRTRGHHPPAPPGFTGAGAWKGSSQKIHDSMWNIPAVFHSSPYSSLGHAVDPALLRTPLPLDPCSPPARQVGSA